MPKLHFYFFCLYNSLYKDGLYLEQYLKTYGRGRILPESRAILGLSASTYFWTIVIRVIVIDIFKPHFRVLFWSFVFEAILMAVIYAIYFFYFVDGNRFTDIYFEYKATNKGIQKQALVKVYWFLGLPLLIIPLLVWWTSTKLNLDLRKY